MGGESFNFLYFFKIIYNHFKFAKKSKFSWINKHRKLFYAHVLFKSSIFKVFIWSFSHSKRSGLMVFIMTSFTTRLKVSNRSTPYSWWNPFTTNLVLYFSIVPSPFPLNLETICFQWKSDLVEGKLNSMYDFAWLSHPL